MCGALQDPPGAPSSIPFHNANYSTSFTYRGNPTYVTTLGTIACSAYQTTGVTYQAQNGAGTVITTAPSASAGYSLPGVVTPNGNGNLATTISYDSSSWAVTSMTAPNGASATTTYDSLGRPSQTTIPDGAVTNYSYTYNPNTQTATLGNRWTKTTLDGFGRVISVVKGHDSTPFSEVDTRYAPCGCSPLGKVSQVSEPYAPGGTVYWTTYTYDASGRTLTVTAPDSSVTTTSYSGNITQVLDPATWKTYTKDLFGNLINVLEPDTPHGYNSSTTYTYNGVNQLTQVSMQTASGTQTRTFTWNGADLVSATNPENGTVNYTYDGAHHVLTRTDAKNQQTQYTYDSYGRLINIFHYPQAPAYPGDPNHPADPSQQVTYYYDSNPFDGIFSTYAWGRLTAVAFGNACAVDGASAATVGYTYMYGYTTAGRVSAQRMRTTVNQSYAPNWSCSPITVDQNASYGWDSQGRMTSLAYPGGVASYQYQYEAMGHLSGMTDSLNNNATVATASYGPAGEMDSLVHGGVSENFSYNSLWQLTGDAATIYTYTAGHNNGRISQSTDRASGEVVNYTYDSLNRLASAQATNGSWGNSYSYDGFGNLTAKTVTAGSAPNFAASYNPATNQQNGLNYDANGNAGYGFANYDVENRPRYSTDGVYAFGYDPQGKRVMRQTGYGTYPAPLTYSSEFSFYGITGQLLAAFTITSTNNSQQSGYPYEVSGVVAKNVYFGGRLILEGLAPVTTDRLGSVRTGAPYYPWGEDRGSAPNQQIKFGTYFRDLPGEDYADQRYYSATSGRFWTPDPGIGTANPANPTSWNRYAYVNADPVNFHDPTGRIEDDPNLEAPTDWPGWGDGGGYPCDGNSFVPDPSCGYSGPIQPPSIFAPSPTCGAANGLTPDQQLAVETVVGENSWWRLGSASYLPGDKGGNPTGPTITASVVFTEDLDMFSVLVNRTAAPGYPGTIGAVASQPGQFAGYSSGKNGGITKYNAAIDSLQGSSPCNDLTGVVNAMNAIFQTGSLLPSNYLFWKAILQGPGIYHVYQPGDIYVGNTAFGIINTH